MPGITCPEAADPGGHAWHLYVIRVEPGQLGMDREAFIRALVGMNIGVSVHFIPLHLHPHYRSRYGFTPAQFPHATAAGETIVSLPLYPRMSDGDVDDVIEAVTSLAGAHAR